MIWDFTVTTNMHHVPVNIEFRGIESLPEGFNLLVYDKERSEPVSLINNKFHFVSNSEMQERNFSVVVSNEKPENQTETPEEFITAYSYPNPFNPSTTIHYNLPQSSIIKITVLNTIGQVTGEFHQGYKEKGSHEFLFDASGLTSGLYFYLIDTDYGTVSGKMLFMK